MLENGHLIKNVIFCYAVWQPEYDKLTQEGVVTQWKNGLPSADEFSEMVEPYANSGGSVVVYDDFQSKLFNKESAEAIEEVVRVRARHLGATTFILFQSLFPPQKSARQISLNVKYLHLFKNPRENHQITCLAKQIMPESYRWIVAAFHEATKDPFSCFLIDLRQECSSKMRFRSSYLPHQLPMKIWFKKGDMI